MTTVRLTSLAERDLEAISDYVAQHNADAATRLIADLSRAVSSLAEAPMRQRVRTEYGGRGRRRLNRRGYAIIYVYDPGEDVVDVERILHGRRNIVPLLIP